MSIHSDKDKAFAARDAYIKDERNGGTANDYWVHAVRIDRPDLKGETT
jgi:hypothetical protein